MDRTIDVRARRGFAELLADRRGLIEDDRYAPQVEAIVAAIVSAFRAKHRVYWFGNGGSAADAQHLAAEFSGRFLRERPALPSEAFSVNPSAVTAISNDFGYEAVFERQVEAFVQARATSSSALRRAGHRPTSHARSRLRRSGVQPRSRLRGTAEGASPRSRTLRSSAPTDTRRSFKKSTSRWVTSSATWSSKSSIL